MYRTFISELGLSWIDSPQTSLGDLNRLDLCPTDEPCISVKLAFPHAHSLIQRGVDVLLIPTVISLSETGYVCPKLMGLPAMLRAGLRFEPNRILSPIIDMKDDPNGWQETWVKAGASLGIKDRGRVLGALKRGIAAWREAQEHAWSGKAPAKWDTGVMGHAYVLNDLLGLKVLDAAKTYGSVVTPERVPLPEACSALRSIPDGEKMWTVEGQILGATLHLIRTGKVSRVIFVSAFSCGPASIIESFVAEEASRYGMPLLSLTVDEHTGDAGLVTRVEAFLDSVQRTRVKKRAEERSDFVHDSSGRSATGRGSPGPLGLVDMGTLGIPIASLLQSVNVEIALPPVLSDDVVDLGKQIAPEFICYPMVTLLGQMRVMAEKGIGRILMVQGKGRCRLGWYAQVMESILQRNGYDVRVIAFDSPFPWKEKGKEFTERGRELGGRYGPGSLLKAAGLALTKLAAIDRAADILREMRAREIRRGQSEILYDRFLKEIEASSSISSCVRAFREFTKDLKDISLSKVEPLRVALVGEIYVLNEPFVNKNVERLLGSLDHRVRVYRSLDVTGWITGHLIRTPGGMKVYRDVTEAASRYLGVNVGGHGQESVGEVVLAGKRDFDGAIHLFPFTCMPEIIAQSILMRVSSDLDFPVMSLMISEQTAQAGFITRLEAFCDLLAGRRQVRG